ncbi:adenylate/guanylate cyclase domain-containing protein [Foetidibacter luteolus]|uniref:adenylate/guanylate cyclase domain-containing protein n=1 Tax=Foetidibacter luteolus TaxID=2608880 RepID=UPI00129B32A4|nr:adenylate/guanylate cyclase domain-containing protein [Foetidibacter luteolus]
MTRILVVDDETDLEILIKQKFRRQIREHEYDFLFAVNGVDALEKLKQNPDVDIVLSDINMPEMDGLTLLDKLSDVSPVLKAVIVSAYGDMDNIRTAMNKGAFDFICKPVNFQDLDTTVRKTIKQVAQVKETLRAIRENDILKMYVDATVLKFMNTKEFSQKLMSNETVEATIVFIDICGFTAITETEPADTVVNLLNRYFDIMVHEIITQNGYVDKFIGDAIMAVFRGDFHLDRAIDACLKIREYIKNMPAADTGLHFTPQVAIGINSGEVIAGNIGSASLKRLDYTVVGDTVNTAQRLQSAARPGQVVIPQSAYETVKESFNCQPLGEVTLKNKAANLLIYEVLD